MSSFEATTMWRSFRSKSKPSSKNFCHQTMILLMWLRTFYSTLICDTFEGLQVARATDKWIDHFINGNGSVPVSVANSWTMFLRLIAVKSTFDHLSGSQLCWPQVWQFSFHKKLKFRHRTWTLTSQWHAQTANSYILSPRAAHIHRIGARAPGARNPWAVVESTSAIHSSVFRIVCDCYWLTFCRFIL